MFPGNDSISRLVLFIGLDDSVPLDRDRAALFGSHPNGKDPDPFPGSFFSDAFNISCVVFSIAEDEQYLAGLVCLVVIGLGELNGFSAAISAAWESLSRASPVSSLLW